MEYTHKYKDMHHWDLMKNAKNLGNKNLTIFVTPENKQLAPRSDQHYWFPLVALSNYLGGLSFRT